ncbi:hypothetical protein CapIbe_016454 [Capra ibex]
MGPSRGQGPYRGKTGLQPPHCTWQPWLITESCFCLSEKALCVTKSALRSCGISSAFDPKLAFLCYINPTKTEPPDAWTLAVFDADSCTAYRRFAIMWRLQKRS